MHIHPIEIQGRRLAHLQGEDGAIRDKQTILSLMEQAHSQGYRDVLCAMELVDTRFFDIKSGIARELASKLKEQNLRLAVYGQLSLVENLAVKAFIKGNGLKQHAHLARDWEAAIAWLVQG